MANDRDKLVLDEQSFEGLLAAAFTIQQHNSRMNAADQEKESPAPPANVTEVKAEPLRCSGCGTPRSASESACQKCGRIYFRPGERLQRNWASLWQMSQEQGTVMEARRKPETEPALSPADPGRPPADSLHSDVLHSDARHSSVLQADVVESHTVFPTTEQANTATQPGVKVPSDDHAKAVLSPPLPAKSSEASDLREPSRSEAEPPNGAGNAFLSDAAEESEIAQSASNVHEEALVSEAVPDRHDSHINDESVNSEPVDAPVNGMSVHGASTYDGPVHVVPEHALALHDLPVHEDSSLVGVRAEHHDISAENWHGFEASPRARSNAFSNLRARVSAHRADIFLALAVVVAATALLWPTSSSNTSDMTPWERILVATGMAYAPEPVMHTQGDPNMKVWVDTHTALYYCPGDDLYGKSSDGHYTTQRQAQADQFEPAERSVCIE